MYAEASEALHALAPVVEQLERQGASIAGCFIELDDDHMFGATVHIAPNRVPDGLKVSAEASKWFHNVWRYSVEVMGVEVYWLSSTKPA